jgi:glutamyl-tRNA reductase
MNLLLLGISHKTAPLEIRERFAVPEARIPEALRQLRADPVVEEALVISTCNRVEFVVRARDGEDGTASLRHFVSSFFSISWDDFSSAFFLLRDDEVVSHLFRVASGLESMVIGEPQILGQIKQAYALASEAGTTGTLLDSLLHRVFIAAKRVRTETSVAELPVSVSSAAVELAEQALGDLHAKTVMIIGAGHMGELAARHLVAKGAAALLVSNRTYDHAVALAEELKGEALRFQEVWRAMQRADIVISSTGCPHYIIRRDDLEPVMTARQGRPLFLVDIAVPRDIDPAVQEIPGCTVVNIDSLKETAGRNLRHREEAMEAAEAILAAELEQFRQRRASRQVAPAIVSLRRRAEQIRRSELSRMRELFGEMTPEQEAALEAVTQGLVNKILHTPCAELKEAAARPDRSEYVGLVRSVFRLEEEPAISEVAVQ